MRSWWAAVPFLFSLNGHAAEVERVHGAAFGTRAVEFYVTSRGCTDKGDFTAVIEEGVVPKLTLIRLAPDMCDATPHMIVVSIDLNTLNTSNFVLGNPFTPMPGL